MHEPVIHTSGCSIHKDSACVNTMTVLYFGADFGFMWCEGTE